MSPPRAGLVGNGKRPYRFRSLWRCPIHVRGVGSGLLTAVVVWRGPLRLPLSAAHAEAESAIGRRSEACFRSISTTCASRARHQAPAPSPDHHCPALLSGVSISRAPRTTGSAQYMVEDGGIPHSCRSKETWRDRAPLHWPGLSPHRRYYRPDPTFSWVDPQIERLGRHDRRLKRRDQPVVMATPIHML